MQSEKTLWIIENIPKCFARTLVALLKITVKYYDYGKTFEL